jgi:hypothetical protein
LLLLPELPSRLPEFFKAPGGERDQANAANLADSANPTPPGVACQQHNFVFQVTLSLEERAMKIGEAIIRRSSTRPA